MSDIDIRKVQTDDLPMMQDIAKRTIDKCYRPFLGDEGVDWFINSGESDRELKKYLAHCDVLLKDNKVIAFTIYFDDLIHLLMVDVFVHRLGIGSLLLAHSEKQLFKNGNATIRLETFEGNNQAISFYMKNGWTIIKKEKDKEHDFVRVFFEKELFSSKGV